MFILGGAVVSLCVWSCAEGVVLCSILLYEYLYLRGAV
jgi:hypothetical protein